MEELGDYLTACDLNQLVEIRKNLDARIKTILDAQVRAFDETRALLGLEQPVKKTRATKGVPVPPKYRNPKDETQTWSGRGLPPRWITDSGKKKEYFLIDKPAKKAKKENSDADTSEGLALG